MPNNFQDFPFLAYGSGPYGGSGNLGQLAPWPGTVPPVLPVCTPKGAVLSPVADAGLFQSVEVGKPVTLDASASHDPNTPRRTLKFTWKQIANGAPTVALTPIAGKPALATFVAPLTATVMDSTPPDKVLEAVA